MSLSLFRCAGCGAFNRVPAPAPSVPRTPICGRCKQPLDTTGAPQEVSADGLAEAIRSSPLPVVVDVWAPWCAPCHAAAPILDGVARANAGRMLVLKVNSDAHPAVSVRYGVRGIPTFLIFRDGRLVAQQAGLPPRAAFTHWIANATRAVASDSAAPT